MRKVTPEVIQSLEENEVFVFGSNLNGWHDGGAARVAVRFFGAKYYQAEGLQGQSYALPTLDHSMEKLPLKEIKTNLERLALVAEQNPDKVFYLTKVGCGIAGFSIEEISGLVNSTEFPDNVAFPQEFIEVNE